MFVDETLAALAPYTSTRLQRRNCVCSFVISDLGLVLDSERTLVDGGGIISFAGSIERRTRRRRPGNVYLLL